MADQAERVILEAEDQVTPITDKANAALDGFEKKAESSHGKVIRISDQTRSSVQRLIASLEKQAETYGKSGVDRLITQRDQLLQRYNREPQAIDAITRSYEKMIAMEEKAAREALAVKAAKEAEEALRSSPKPSLRSATGSASLWRTRSRGRRARSHRCFPLLVRLALLSLPALRYLARLRRPHSRPQIAWGNMAPA